MTTLTLRELQKMRYLTIDEIRIRNGHRDLTLVMDLDSRAVLFVGEGKGTQALDPFWKMLRRSRAKVRLWQWI